MITGTIVFSIAGFHGATSQSAALETFLQNGTSNFRTMASSKSRSISKGGSTYLMEDIKETDQERGYLLQHGSIINIIADYPLPKIVEDDLQTGSNLTKISIYEILPNGSIINISQGLKDSFTTGDAYATSSYTKLESSYSPSILNPDEIEVMAMTQEVRDLGARINSIDDKYDKKIDGISEKLFQELKDISKFLSGIDGRLGIIETKVSGIENRTTNWKLYVLLPLITTACGGIAVFAFTKILGY